MPLAFGRIPDDLGHRNTFTDGIKHIEQLIAQFIALDPGAHHIGIAHIICIVRCSINRNVQLAHCSLSGSQHTGIMQIAFFNGLGQFEVSQRVALVGLPEN